MEQIDVYPSHEFAGIKLRPGRPYPFGATLVPGGVNFSIYSANADYCVLVLFEKGASEPYAEIPFRGLFKQPGTDEELAMERLRWQHTEGISHYGAVFRDHSHPHREAVHIRTGSQHEEDGPKSIREI